MSKSSIITKRYEKIEKRCMWKACGLQSAYLTKYHRSSVSAPMRKSSNTEWSKEIGDKKRWNMTSGLICDDKTS